MKTRFFLLAFLSLGLFTACEVEDDSPNDTQQINEELLGIWYFDAMIVQDEEIPYDDHEECGKDYIEFNNYGTYQQVDKVTENTISLTLTDRETVVLDIATLNAKVLLIEGMEDFDEDGEDERVQQRFTRD